MRPAADGTPLERVKKLAEWQKTSHKDAKYARFAKKVGGFAFASLGAFA